MRIHLLFPVRQPNCLASNPLAVTAVRHPSPDVAFRSLKAVLNQKLQNRLPKEQPETPVKKEKLTEHRAGLHPFKVDRVDLEGALHSVQNNLLVYFQK